MIQLAFSIHNFVIAHILQIGALPIHDNKII